MLEKEYKTEYGNVHYWISKDWDSSRRTIFFLHGLTASHRLFNKQVNYFKKDYNVICWDAPAHGASRPFMDFTYEKAALAAVGILDENNVDKAVLVGQSMGGFITQSVLKRAPERVMGFVSIDSTPFGEKYYSSFDKWILRQIEWMSLMYPDNYLRKAIAKQVSVKKDTYDNMYSMLTCYDKKELCHLMAVGYAGFLEDNCDLEIKCPMLLIVGEKDKTGKVISYNKQWSKDTGAPVVRIKDAAHNSNDDQPEIVNEKIDTFIRSLK